MRNFFKSLFRNSGGLSELTDPYIHNILDEVHVGAGNILKLEESDMLYKKLYLIRSYKNGKLSDLLNNQGHESYNDGTIDKDGLLNIATNPTQTRYPQFTNESIARSSFQRYCQRYSERFYNESRFKGNGSK